MNTAKTTRLIGAEPDPATAQARIACLEVITTFFQLVDGGHASRTVELLTTDAEMTIGDVTVKGEELAAAMRKRETDGIRRVHFSAEPSFRLLGPDEAETETLLQLFHLGDEQKLGPAARALTHLKDRFVRGGDGVWRLSRRAVTILAGSE
ncbi:nuclear transport factor 2 family protein [Saccharopolyspora sp. K220]|uniref:nuclear transport factor 2 family protein n=1 Tax=Saccharopolyspora soli TaxID=2926618 RepID=UPI001F56769B|nr:nuclear transport factor 2 family protein [Saccharopolyspora soli]MCI2420025.1 nuclear transport factor 2 family protein [Saccharopolyspora soli]